MELQLPKVTERLASFEKTVSLSQAQERKI